MNRQEMLRGRVMYVRVRRDAVIHARRIPDDIRRFITGTMRATLMWHQLCANNITIHNTSHCLHNNASWPPLSPRLSLPPSVPLPYDWYLYILLLCIVYGRLPRVIRRVILSSRYYINVGSPRRVFDYDGVRSLDYIYAPDRQDRVLFHVKCVAFAWPSDIYR